MKTLSSTCFALLAAFCLFAGSMVSAETAGSYTAADGAEVRAAYQRILNSTEAIADMYQMQGREEVIAQAREALASATDDELAPFAQALPKIHQWQKVTNKWTASMGSNDVLEAKEHGIPTMAASDGFPDADYFHSVRPSELTMIIGLEVMNTAEGVQMIASRICEQVGVLIGEGGNTSLACLVTDVIYVAAMFVWNTLDQVDGDYNSAENEAIDVGNMPPTFGSESDVLIIKLLFHSPVKNGDQGVGSGSGEDVGSIVDALNEYYKPRGILFRHEVKPAKVLLLDEIKLIDTETVAVGPPVSCYDIYALG